jgi:hypothetical protein
MDENHTTGREIAMELYSLIPDIKRYKYRGLGSLALPEGEVWSRASVLLYLMPPEESEFCDKFAKVYGRETLLNIFMYVIEHQRFDIYKYKNMSFRRLRRLNPLIFATVQEVWNIEQAIAEGKTWEEYVGLTKPRDICPDTPMNQRGFGTSGTDHTPRIRTGGLFATPKRKREPENDEALRPALRRS